ncbi:MAG: hypothetical protein V4529_11885 [Gemmatimonadota bacterium]
MSLTVPAPPAVPLLAVATTLAVAGFPGEIPTEPGLGVVLQLKSPVHVAVSP